MIGEAVQVFLDASRLALLVDTVTVAAFEVGGGPSLFIAEAVIVVAAFNVVIVVVVFDVLVICRNPWTIESCRC